MSWRGGWQAQGQSLGCEGGAVLGPPRCRHSMACGSGSSPGGQDRSVSAIGRSASRLLSTCFALGTVLNNFICLP